MGYKVFFGQFRILMIQPRRTIPEFGQYLAIFLNKNNIYDFQKKKKSVFLVSK